MSDVIDGCRALAAVYAQQAIREKLIDHTQYIARYGQDMPEIREWTWGRATRAGRVTIGLSRKGT